MPKRKLAKRPFPRPKKGSYTGTDEYDLKGILDYRFDRNSERAPLYFLVEWKGYPLSKSTWEMFSNLVNSWNIVRDFLKMRKVGEFLKTLGKRLETNHDRRLMEVVDVPDGDEEEESEDE